MFGFKRRTPGAMAEYMIYNPDALVHKVSKDLPPAHAAFAEPLSCALHGVERGEITFNDVVVVAGCGPIGLGMIAGAKAKNPGWWWPSTCPRPSSRWPRNAART